MEYESTCSRWRVVRRELLPGIQEKEVGMDLGSITDMRKFNPHLNQIYFEMNSKNKDEYRSVRIHINPFTNHPQAQRSNWIYGTRPENLKALPPLLNSRINRMPTQMPFWCLKRILESVREVRESSARASLIWLTECSVHIARESERRSWRSCSIAQIIGKDSNK